MLSPVVPTGLLATLEGTEGYNAADFSEAHLQQPPVSVRINEAKPANLFTNAQPVKWCPQGRYLSQRPMFTLDPLLHAGCYYVQEASSMFLHTALTQITQPGEPVNCLDMCASPGGKTTLAAATLPAGSLLLANEAIRNRVENLYENVVKWGNDTVYISQNDPADFRSLTGFFQVIIADVPCSGSGLIRRDATASSHWSHEAVKLCSHRQQRILADVLPSLQPGGFLVYSTCSFSADENEEVIKWLCMQFPLEVVSLKVHDSWGITDTGWGYRFWPHSLLGEGFFLCVLKKNGENSVAELPKAKPAPENKNALKVLERHLPALHQFVAKEIGSDIILFSKAHQHQIQMLSRHLRLRKSGLKAGRVIRNELLPNHELAMWHQKLIGFAATELTRNEAIAYLQKNELRLPDATTPGWAAVTHKGLRLGWAKHLAGRINNYYPSDWRIRMNQPEQ